MIPNGLKQWATNRDYQQLVKNTSSLGIVQITNTLLPLITIPYLTRTLGVTQFGLVMMAQSLMIYLTIIIDYGFNLSATKSIAEHHGHHNAISKIACCVACAKVGLLLLSAIILIGLIAIIPLFQAHIWLISLSFFIVIGNCVTPSFLFQGLEHMGPLAWMNLMAKLAFTGAIFLCITQPSDYIFVHLLWGVSYLIVGVLSIGWIRKTQSIYWVRPSLSDILLLLKTGSGYALSRVSIAAYMYSNVLFVGLLLNPISAGLYSGAEKLLFAITTVYAPIIEAIYPFISRTKRLMFASKILMVTTAINLIVCSIAYFIAPIAIPIILGDVFRSSIPLFQWMLIIAALHVPTSIIGYPILGALGHESVANRSVILGAIFHVFALILFQPFLTQPIHFIWVMIATQTIIFGIRLQVFFRLWHD